MSATSTGASEIARSGRRVTTITSRTVVAAVSAVFLASNIVFALSLGPGPACVVIVGCLAALTLVVLRPARTDRVDPAIPVSRIAACLALAVVILVLGGETHLFYANADWLIRDAVLADLSRTTSLPTYEVAGGEYVLRAPIGMYMLPALAGRGIGLAAAHAALLAQNTLLLGLTLSVLLTLGRGWRHLCVLVLFAGLCVLPLLINALVTGDARNIASVAHPYDEWNPLFQYSGTITQFFWVPNHALPGWWIAALLILYERRAVDISTLGLSVAGLVVWSPLAVLPAIPCLVWFVATDPRSTLLRSRTWLGFATSLTFLPVVLYLLIDTSSLKSGLPVLEPGFPILYVAFVAFQLPAAEYVRRRWGALSPSLRGLTVIASTLLLTLPFLSFGPNNDLVMRGSIAALVIVAFAFGDVLLAETDRRTRFAMVGWAMVAIGSASPLVEVLRALRTPSFDISRCGLIQALRSLGDERVPANYMAASRSVPEWLLVTPPGLPSDPVAKECWPDHPSRRGTAS